MALGTGEAERNAEKNKGQKSGDEPLGCEEFGEMTEEKWRERHDWGKVSRRTLEMEKFGVDGGESRKERYDW